MTCTQSAVCQRPCEYAIGEWTAPTFHLPCEQNKLARFHALGATGSERGRTRRENGSSYVLSGTIRKVANGQQNMMAAISCCAKEISRLWRREDNC